MASSLLSSTLSLSSSSLSSLPPLTKCPKSLGYRIREPRFVAVRVQTLDFTSSFFEGGLGDDDDDEEEPPIGGSALLDIEEKEEPPCPPGLRRYETMAVLRPDLSEDERLAATQKYEELLVAGGGMYVEVFNRGVIPLSYSIKSVNRAGETNTYMDGIYLLFTYCTKPGAIEVLEENMKMDDNVIRWSSFKIRKRRYNTF